MRRQSVGARRIESARSIAGLTPFACDYLPVASEQQLQSELNLAGRIRRANRTERCIRSSGIGHAEIRVVQQIEELRAELQPHTLVNPERLIRRKVPHLESRCAEGIAPHIAVGSCR